MKGKLPFRMELSRNFTFYLLYIKSSRKHIYKQYKSLFV